MAEEYITEYKVDGYARDFYLKTLKSARYVAMKESMKEPRPYMDYGKKYNPYTDTPKEVMNYYPKWIEEVKFVKAGGFLQQVGKSKTIGYVKFVSEKQRWAWRPTNIKDSVWLDKDGGAVRKVAPKERDLLHAMA